MSREREWWADPDRTPDEGPTALEVACAASFLFAFGVLAGMAVFGMVTEPAAKQPPKAETWRDWFPVAVPVVPPKR